jgi:hypothetical protein
MHACYVDQLMDQLQEARKTYLLQLIKLLVARKLRTVITNKLLLSAGRPAACGIRMDSALCVSGKVRCANHFR